MKFKSYPLLLIVLLALMGFSLISCSKAKVVKYQGYIEGRYVELTTPRQGVLQTLLVTPGQWVKAGQLAFALDPQPELAELEQAQAHLQEQQNTLQNLIKGERNTVLNRLLAQKQAAETQLTLDNKTLDRYKSLLQKNIIAKAQYEEAEARVMQGTAKLKEALANLDEATTGARSDIILSQNARVMAAKAAVDIANWNLVQKSILIPQDGLVNDTYFETSEYVQAGQPVISLLAPENIEIIFFIPERMLSKIKIGQPVTVDCNGCNHTYNAKISTVYSKAEYTPPIIFTEYTRDKLLYKVKAHFYPAKDAINFHPGQPVDVLLTIG